jgi:hypothetical protein
MDSKLFFALALIIAAFFTLSEAATTEAVVTDGATSATMSCVTLALGLLAAVVRM